MAKVIKVGTKNLTIAKKLNCPNCDAVIEIMPEDCEGMPNNLNFWVKCPWCKRDVLFHARDVGPLFWLRIHD